jgi:DNA-binding IclR family transcriptional regulator
MQKSDGIYAVKKTFQLLELMVEHNGTLTVSQISEHLQCSVSSATRFLQTLQDQGYVRKNRQTGHYELNYRLYSLGSKMVSNDPIVEKLRPLAHEVSQRYDISVNINTLLGKNAILLFPVTRFYNKDLDFRIGETAPAYCTSSGKAILSQMSEEELNLYFEGLQLRTFQRNTYTEEGIREELKAAKKNGYAVCQEEYVSGVFSVSFPLRDLHGHLYAFTLIMPLRKKKDVFQPKVLHDIRSQLKKIF